MAPPGLGHRPPLSALERARAHRRPDGHGAAAGADRCLGGHPAGTAAADDPGAGRSGGALWLQQHLWLCQGPRLGGADPAPALLLRRDRHPDRALAGQRHGGGALRPRRAPIFLALRHRQRRRQRDPQQPGLPLPAQSPGRSGLPGLRPEGGGPGAASRGAAAGLRPGRLHHRPLDPRTRPVRPPPLPHHLPGPSRAPRGPAGGSRQRGRAEQGGAHGGGLPGPFCGHRSAEVPGGGSAHRRHAGPDAASGRLVAVPG